jgi:hypothetical protein
VEQARQRLAHLDAHGPTPQAFLFHERYSPNDAAASVAGGA